MKSNHDSVNQTSGRNLAEEQISRKKLKSAEIPPEKILARATTNLKKEKADTHNLEAINLKRKVVFLSRAMLFSSIPHSEVSDSFFVRDNGICLITMQVKNGQMLPFGRLPRLILFWICTQAVRCKNREISIGRTITDFAKKLGLSVSGGVRGDVTRLRLQLQRLFLTSFTISSKKTNEVEFNDVRILDDGQWQSHGNLKYFSEKILLSEPFYEDCISHAIPLEFEVLRNLRSVFALDIYCWLTWRMSSLKKVTYIRYEFLNWQFGANYSSAGYRHILDFRKAFKSNLKIVMLHYPMAKVRIEKKGIRLWRSETHVHSIFSKSLVENSNCHNLAGS
ncbi:replication protein RepA [Undibacterium griseum]|uniref:RepA protein n=1 Tax=Undibacterium griseum TaxID=2762295 RepID=A0ABR6YKU7_9BURK|nr:replication protein RepA [Undibacterium griseum]MBC3884520.1 hypothetical protein [Undibacterium griseum]